MQRLRQFVVWVFFSIWFDRETTYDFFSIIYILYMFVYFRTNFGYSKPSTLDIEWMLRQSGSMYYILTAKCPSNRWPQLYSPYPNNIHITHVQKLNWTTKLLGNSINNPICLPHIRAIGAPWFTKYKYIYICKNQISAIRFQNLNQSGLKRKLDLSHFNCVLHEWRWCLTHIYTT